MSPLCVDSADEGEWLSSVMRRVGSDGIGSMQEDDDVEDVESLVIVAIEWSGVR